MKRKKKVEIPGTYEAYSETSWTFRRQTEIIKLGFVKIKHPDENTINQEKNP